MRNQYWINKIYEVAQDRELARQRVLLILATGVAQRYQEKMLIALYEQCASNRDFLDYLAVKHCGDVY